MSSLCPPRTIPSQRANCSSRPQRIHCIKNERGNVTAASTNQSCVHHHPEHHNRKHFAQNPSLSLHVCHAVPHQGQASTPATTRSLVQDRLDLGEGEITQMLEIYPDLADLDFHGQVLANIQAMEACMPRRALVRLLTQHPQLLGSEVCEPPHGLYHYM